MERIYQRKTQLEHILLQPDTYVGSTEESTEPIFVFDSERGVVVKRNITYVPELYKIFDEILGMSCMSHPRQLIFLRKRDYLGITMYTIDVQCIYMQCTKRLVYINFLWL